MIQLHARGTFVDLINQRAEEQRDARAYCFLTEGEVNGPTEELSYGALARRARAIGALLQREGGAKERALLIYPPGLEFVCAFFGCLFGEVIAVPAYPPDPTRVERTLPRLRAIAKDSGARFVLTIASFRDLAEGLFSLAPELASLRWISTDEIPDSFAEGRQRPTIQPESCAFLQYTSGSTSAPKGVIISHQNLLVNAEEIYQMAEHNEESVYVCWVPSYHDMGLIGGILQPIYGGFLGVLMSPLSFLQRPMRWLEAISHFGGTTSPFPNFALDLCVRKAKPEEIERLDLRSWKVGCNGAEPVRYESLTRFSKVFAKAGFSPNTHYPAYGLAEHTLIASGGKRGEPPRTFWVEPESLRRQEIVPMVEGQGRAIIGCGRSLRDHEIAIVDPETRLCLGDLQIGEIWLRGPSVAGGYWGRPEETKETFDARLLTGEGPYLRTGDLGFLKEGEIFITGRRKDLIIVRGKNHYPQDLERSIEGAHPNIRPGCVAAFSVEYEGEEHLGIALEIDTRRAVEPKEIVSSILKILSEEHELQPRVIALLEAGALPKTSSGKLQRSATREALLTRSLATIGDLWRPTSEAASSLYVGLARHAEKLERRNTNYRFDLDKDVAWEKLSWPGDYFSPEYLEANGLDVTVLKRIPGAYELFQWAFAVTICEQFISLEESLLRFTQKERKALGPLRSVVLLEEEEEKHISLFRRYAEHLRSQEPAFSDDLLAHRASCARFLAGIEERSLYYSDAAYHYTSWLLILFFEEFTIYLYDRLAAAPAGLQPAWLSAHAAHRREELQHVVTDVAHLKAIAASEEERYQWSKQVFHNLARSYNALFGWETALQLCAKRYPEARAAARPESPKEPFFLSLLQERAFSQTREAAPYLSLLFEKKGASLATLSPETARSSEARARLGAWLVSWVSARLGVLPTALDPKTPLSRYGLDSISAITLSGDLESWLGRRLSPALVYEHPSIERLLEHLLSLLDGGPALGAEALREARSTSAPASARQARLWHLERAHPKKLLDHITAVYEFPEPLPKETHQEILRALLARHQPLRVALQEREGRVEQEILPALEPLLTVSLVCEASYQDWTFAVRQAAAVQDRLPFDLSRAPLVRASLLEGEKRQALILTVHHAVTDGWSMEVIAEELSASYHASRLGRSAPVLPPLRLQYPDVAAKEARFLESEEAARRLHWWRDKLAARLATRPLPWDFEGASVSASIPPSLVASLESLSARQGVSLYITLLTAFHCTLQRRTQETDLVVNTHLFNRPSEEEKALVGYFVNLLTLRTELPEGIPFLGALERVYQSWREALSHVLPISYLVKELRPDLYRSRYMPSRVAFNMLSLPRHNEHKAPPLERRRELPPDPSFLFFEEMLLADPRQPDGGIGLTLWYNRLALTQKEAQANLDDFCRFLWVL